MDAMAWDGDRFPLLECFSDQSLQLTEEKKWLN
jgi:hypothetical protein